VDHTAAALLSTVPVTDGVTEVDHETDVERVIDGLREPEVDTVGDRETDAVRELLAEGDGVGVGSSTSHTWPYVVVGFSSLKPCRRPPQGMVLGVRGQRGSMAAWGCGSRLQG
jgi:hypothetical protein